MGFRNPATSAAAVDTRTTPAGPGVRVVQDSSVPASPRGVVQFTDGFDGDGPAQVFQHAEANPRSANTSQGGGITLDGGSYVGGTVTAPKLDLYAIPDPLQPAGGGYLKGARLTGVPFVDNGEAWAALPLGPAWAAWDTTTNLPALRRDSAGDVQLRGMVKLAAGFTIAAGATLAVSNLSAGFFLPGSRAWRQSTVLNASGFFVALIPAWIDTNGALTVYNVTASAFTAGFGFSLGFSAPTI